MIIRSTNSIEPVM